MDILNKLGVNWILLIGYFVNFLIIFFVLNKFVFQKVLKNMDARKKLTEDLLKNSASTQKALEDAQKQFEEVIAKANDQAQNIVGKADDSAKSLAEQMKEKAQEQAEIILEKAKLEINKEKADLKNDLEKQIGILVAETVEKVVGELPHDQKQKIMSNIDKKFVK